jgi:hypothetical protein
VSIDLPSRLDLYRIGRAYMVSRATRLDAATVDVAGSDANLFVGSTSFVGAATVQQLGDRTAALTIDGAEGEDLDRLAWDRYRLIRPGAVAAVGAVRFFRPTTGSDGTIPIGTKVTSLAGIEYVTTTAASFATTSLQQPANVRATRAGRDYQVGRNQIRKVAGLFDSTIQVTNDEPTAGGENRMQDDQFRLLIRGAAQAERRATLGAIQYGATTVPGIATAQAIEVIDGDARPARAVRLFVADSSGVASAALGASVDVALLEYRACGIAVITSTSIPQIVTIRLQLAFLAGVETSTLTDTIRAAIVEYVNSLAVNATLYRASLLSVLHRYRDQGLIPDDSTIAEPTGDLVPTPGSTIRTTLTNVTVI